MAMHEHWIKKAINPKNKGKFSAKAKKAGKTTLEYAEAHEGDKGKTGRQARLAETLINLKK